MNSIEHNPYISTGSYILEKQKISVIFSTKDGTGTLAAVLNMIREVNLNMSRIESRPSTNRSWDFDFFCRIH